MIENLFDWISRHPFIFVLVFVPSYTLGHSLGRALVDWWLS